jgi:kynurenine formamidase
MWCSLQVRYRSALMGFDNILRRGLGARLCVTLASAFACAACVVAPTLDETRLVELSHVVDSAAPLAPGVAPFALAISQAPPGEPWQASARLDAPDRSGAYLQAPHAFADGRRAVDELAPSQWIAPIRVIDVARACEGDRNYRASVEDLRAHERLHGRIQPQSAVLVRTGWDGRWSTAERYFGTGPDQRPNFPGLDPALARELVARRVEIVGIDAPDIDGGYGIDQASSRALAAANIPVLGNLAGLAALPPRGATLIAAPLKLRGAPTSPARVFAALP